MQTDRKFCLHCGSGLAGKQTSYCSGRCREAAKNAGIRAEFIEAYGGKCVCCGEATPEFLTLEHSRGGGNRHRRQVTAGRGGVALYRKLRADGWPKDQGYQLMCANCNFSRAWHTYCPHEAKTHKIVEGALDPVSTDQHLQPTLPGVQPGVR